MFNKLSFASQACSLSLIKTWWVDVAPEDSWADVAPENSCQSRVYATSLITGEKKRCDDSESGPNVAEHPQSLLL